MAYPGRPHPALDEVSLTIRPGERLVVTGPSGAGKSSLLALLLRFIQPAAGTIQAGGADLATLAADPWRAQIAWVPQQPHLFAGTVADNIALGQPGASPREHHARGPAGRARPSSSRPCPAGTTRSWGSGRCACPRASGSGSRWPGRSCGTRRCCCWTSPPRTWTRRRPARSRRSWTRSWPTAPSCWSRISRAWAAGGGRVIRLERGRLVGRPARPATVPAAVTR